MAYIVGNNKQVISFLSLKCEISKSFESDQSALCLIFMVERHICLQRGSLFSSPDRGDCATKMSLMSIYNCDDTCTKIYFKTLHRNTRLKIWNTKYNISPKRVDST